MLLNESQALTLEVLPLVGVGFLDVDDDDVCLVGEVGMNLLHLLQLGHERGSSAASEDQYQRSEIKIGENGEATGDVLDLGGTGSLGSHCYTDLNSTAVSTCALMAVSS